MPEIVTDLLDEANPRQAYVGIVHPLMIVMEEEDDPLENRIENLDDEPDEDERPDENKVDEVERREEIGQRQEREPNPRLVVMKEEPRRNPEDRVEVCDSHFSVVILFCFDQFPRCLALSRIEEVE